MIAALDIGTTSVRCFIISPDYEIKGTATQKVNLLNPQPGYYEIDPDDLWQKIKYVIVHAIKNANLSPADIKSLGVCCQRCTFLTWNHRTNEYYHNFITWKDLRADRLVDEWNSGYILKTVNTFSYVLYLLTRSKRFLAGSVIKMMNGQVTLRLLFELLNNTKLQTAIKQNKVRLELLDSWVLYKLRSGDGLDLDVEHITDITSCTATGLYDPFTLSWSPLVKVFGIDTNWLPKVVDNGYRNFGHLNSKIFGESNVEWQNVSIPITCSISDQTASIWGSHCFQGGDVKVTCGTGAFLNFITGSECYASIMGLYPLVAWQFQNHAKTSKRERSQKIKTTYCVEAAAYDMGTVIEWAQNCGLFEDVSSIAELADSVENTNGVFFVPAFSGLGPPINDNKATSGFIGVTPSTTRAHLVRAILEAIVFRLVQLCETVEKETNYKLKILKIDGGVSRNSFVCQALADTSAIAVERAQNAESSIMGVAYMCNYVTDSTNSQSFEDLKRFRKVERLFPPRTEKYVEMRTSMAQWEQAIERFGKWY